MKLHFLAVYKPGHEWEGLPVERGRRCDCGRWFSQQVVNKVFLEEMSEGRRISFLKSCELVDYSKGQAAWFPKYCPSCERRQIAIVHANERATAHA
jgi:hypothetical protein